MTDFRFICAKRQNLYILSFGAHEPYILSFLYDFFKRQFAYQLLHVTYQLRAARGRSELGEAGRGGASVSGTVAAMAGVSSSRVGATMAGASSSGGGGWGGHGRTWGS